MIVAFYAPMKPPDHARPSGDRRMGRLLIRALEANGHQVLRPSRFRTWDPTGDAHRQHRLARIGSWHANRLISRWCGKSAPPAPQIWITYHVYHKAPDWIGPDVCTSLRIPYVIIEASHAAKQTDGKWALGCAAAGRAITQANVVITMNSDDTPGIVQLRNGGAGLVSMSPFLEPPVQWTPVVARRDRSWLLREHAIRPGRPWLITVAMMRHDSKLESYRLLAQALRSLLDSPWSLMIVGGGPAHKQVREAFGRLPRERVFFLGELDSNRIYDCLRASDLFVWPAVNEAYGMALLEAHACGVPIVAGRYGGVADIVLHGETGLLVTDCSAANFALAVRSLLDDPKQLQGMRGRARRKVENHHNIETARQVLDQALSDAVQSGRAPNTTIQVAES